MDKGRWREKRKRERGRGRGRHNGGKRLWKEFELKLNQPNIYTQTQVGNQWATTTQAQFAELFCVPSSSSLSSLFRELSLFLSSFSLSLHPSPSFFYQVSSHPLSSLLPPPTSFFFFLTRTRSSKYRSFRTNPSFHTIPQRNRQRQLSNCHLSSIVLKSTADIYIHNFATVLLVL